MTDNFAESAVIGCILLKPEIIAQIIEALKPEDFSNADLGEIYSKMIELFNQNKNIDPVNLELLLSKDKIGLAIEAATETPTISHYLEYVEVVKKSAVLNRAEQKALAALAHIHECEYEESESAAADLLKCYDDYKTQTGVSAKEGFLNFCNAQDERRQYIKTGIGKIDEFIFLDKGDFVIIGGRPSSGKTALSLQMMLHMARDHKVLYFSLETSPQKIFDRLIANCTDTAMDDIKHRNIKDWESITNSFENFSKLNLEVVPASGFSVEKIKAKAIQEKADIVFIDYLTLISESGKSLYESTTKISINLHTLAQKYNITVVALAQLNRSGEEKVPTMATLRESGQIEQDADAIMLLYKDEKDDENKRKLNIAKNKDGQTGVIKLNFNGAIQKFTMEEYI